MNKNIIKILLIFIFIIFTSGCSVEYTLSINEDLSVNENVVATEVTNRLESRTKLKGTQAVNYIANMFIKDSSKYTLTTNEDGKNTVVKANAVYDNLDDFSNQFNNDIFDKPIITKDGDNVNITINQNTKLGGDSPSTPIYDNIDVVINIPFEVIDTNATIIGKNQYKWSFEKEEELKSIKLTYKENTIKNKININVNNKKYSFEYWYIILGCVVIFIIILVSVIFIKNKKNNVV